MDTVKSYVFLVLTQGTCVLVHWTLNVVSDIESLHLILYIKIGLIGTYKSGWFLKISCTLLHISLLESYDTRARIHLDPLGSTQTCGAMSKLSHQTLSQCLRFLLLMTIPCLSLPDPRLSFTIYEYILHIQCCVLPPMESWHPTPPR